MQAPAVLFSLVGAAAVASALLMITRRNPVSCVLFLIVNFFCLSVLYLTLHAQFIAVIQIIVYAGAIMVLFLFVIMLLSLGEAGARAERPGLRRLAGIVAGAAVLVEIVLGAGLFSSGGVPAQSGRAAGTGTVEFIGGVLYRGYLLPFEITSILLLAAMVGVIVLAKKKPG